MRYAEMFKQILLVLTLTLVCVTQSTGATYFRYNGAGFGANVGLANPQDFDAALGGGVHLALEWDLGEPGRVQYYPSVDGWVAPAIEQRTLTQHTWGTTISPLGISYWFPAPEKFPVLVNAGFDIGVSFMQKSVDYFDDDQEDTHDLKTGIGIGLYGAINLVALDPIVPFAELKLTLGSWVVVRSSVGVTFRFGKPVKPRQESEPELLELYEY